jgi:hypothetical protein
MGASDPSDSPGQGGADRKARAIRDRAMELVADASVHAERISAAAERLGLTPDLLDGVGDQLYQAAVAQLDVASKSLERSQRIVDRLFEIGARQLEASRLLRIDVAPGAAAHLRFVVRNPSPRAAAVSVEAEWDGGAPLAPRVGRPALPGGRETSIEIAIAAGAVERGRVYAGSARVRMAYDGQRSIELPRHDFEIWVTGGD